MSRLWPPGFSLCPHLHACSGVVPTQTRLLCPSAIRPQCKVTVTVGAETVWTEDGSVHSHHSLGKDHGGLGTLGASTAPG